MIWGGWQTSTGSYPTNSWCWIDGNQDGIQERYYFNESGYLLVNTTTPDNNIVDANGACVVDGAVCQAKTGSTYFRSETWRDNGPESEVGFDEFCNEYYKLIQETLGMSLEEYLNNTPREEIREDMRKSMKPLIDQGLTEEDSRKIMLDGVRLFYQGNGQ